MPIAQGDQKLVARIFLAPLIAESSRFDRPHPLPANKSRTRSNRWAQPIPASAAHEPRSLTLVYRDLKNAFPAAPWGDVSISRNELPEGPVARPVLPTFVRVLGAATASIPGICFLKSPQGKEVGIAYRVA